MRVSPFPHFFAKTIVGLFVIKVDMGILLIYFLLFAGKKRFCFWEDQKLLPIFSLLEASAHNRGQASRFPPHSVVLLIYFVQKSNIH